MSAMGGLPTFTGRYHSQVMPSDRPKPCCTTMWTVTRTREDLLAEPEIAADMDLTNWAPLVEWADHVGGYVMGNTAIFYCPWCGSLLPERHDEALKEGRKTGIWIEFTSDGRVSASQDGQSVDPDALLAKLEAATRDQD
jgi:hypothetical protein